MQINHCDVLLLPIDARSNDFTNEHSWVSTDCIWALFTGFLRLVYPF